MKKLKIGILIVFAILLFNTNRVFATSASAGLMVDKTTVKPNDLITVSLNANCEEGLSFVSTNINYDSSVLTLQSKNINSNWVNYGGDKLELFVNSSDKITNATVCTFIFKINENAKAGNTKIETTAIEITDINNNEYTKPKSTIDLTINVENTVESNTENSNENNSSNNTVNNTAAPNTQVTENTNSTLEGNTANNNAKNNTNRNNTIKPQVEKETKNEITEGKNDIENSNILIAQPEIKENENILTIADSVQNNNIIKNNYIPAIAIIFAIMILLIIMLIVLILKKKHLE